MTVEISAPGKLMLFGEHAVVYGYPCVVTAVDQRMRVIIDNHKGGKIIVKAPDVGLQDYSIGVNELTTELDLPKEARFVVTAVANFYRQYGIRAGLEIKTRSDFSSKFGFGSSSAVTVAVIKGLSELFAVDINKRNLFDLSYKTVLDVQGVGSGFDLAAAIWGGTLWFVGGGKTIIPLGVEQLSVVVGYTGVKADTPTLVRQVAEKNRTNPEITTNIFKAISVIVHKARSALENRNWPRLGELMDKNQGLLESLGVSTEELSSLICAARESGAFGAKLSGAGGGDCMIALVDDQTRLAAEESITKGGGQVLSVKLNAEGVRNESDR